MDLSINYFAILVAGIASMAVGFFWYSEKGFGKSWMRLKGYTHESLKSAQNEMGKLYGISFLLSLLMAYMLSHVMGLSEAFYNYSILSTGATSAFFMWLGFVMPVKFKNQMFGEKKWKLFAIDTGYQLASLLIMGLVIASIG